MLLRSFTFLIIAGAVWTAGPVARPASAADAGTSSIAGTSPGLAAIARAAEQQRYAYVVFWKVDGEPTQRTRAAVDAAMETLRDKADAVSVCVAAPEEKATVDAFKVARAPMPLVLAVAPNGAVTKAWPADFQPAAAAEGIVSAGLAACLKPLQEEKLVLLTVHNANTASAGPALEAAAGFLADGRFAAGAAGVEIDPADPSEAKFLADLKVSPAVDQSVTVLLAPPGKPVATFTGAVTTAQIIAAVTDAKNGCCPDGKCGPGQCCPGGKCGPTQKPSAKGVSK
jgi:uncharacterized low-complexity protein